MWINFIHYDLDSEKKKKRKLNNVLKILGDTIRKFMIKV